MSTIKVCPRCGNSFSYIERRRRGERVYFYAVHESYEDGKRHVKKCYLGPAQYYYVWKLHRDTGLDIDLQGAINADRALDYLEDIVEVLEHAQLTLQQYHRLVQLTAKLREILVKVQLEG